MPDASAIAGALASLQTAKQLLGAMLTLRDARAFQAKAVEVNTACLNAQRLASEAEQERSALIKRVGELEAEIARLKEWQADKERYELKDMRAGVLAYALKPEAAGAEPMHRLCPNCYHDDHKSILQRTEKLDGGRRVHVCPRCNLKLAW